MRAVSAIWSTLTASKLDSRNSRVATSMRSPVIWPACSLVGRPLCRRGLLAGLALVTFIQLFSLGHFRKAAQDAPSASSDTSHTGLHSATEAFNSTVQFD